MRAAVLSLMPTNVLLDVRPASRQPVSPIVIKRRGEHSKRKSSSKGGSFSTRLKSVLSRVSSGILILGQRDVDRLMQAQYKVVGTTQTVDNKEQSINKARKLEKNRIDRYIASGM